MKMYKYPITEIPHVKLMSIEKLDYEHQHVTRTTNETILYYIIDGTLNIESNNVALTLVPGDMYIFDKGEFQKALGKSKCTYNYLHFFNSLESIEMSANEIVDFYTKSKQKYISIFDYDYDISNSGNDYLLIPQKINVSNSQYFKKILACFKHGCFNHHSVRSEHFNFRSNIMVAELFLYLHLTMSSKPLYDEGKKTYINSENFNEITVKKIIQYLNENLHIQITSQILEDEFGYSFDYMNRCFKSFTNYTIFSYLRQIRIEQAKIILYTKNTSIGEIAEQVGFCNVYYFSSTFKAITGYTPSQYMKSNNLKKH